MRMRLTVRLAVVTAGGLLGTAAAAAPAQASAQIAFYPDLADFVSPSSQAAVRPRLVLLTEDGSVVVRRVRWRSWGGKAARGKGTLTASDCNPNCAGGHLTNRAAKVVLAKPGVVLGHRVYRCIQLTVPSRRSSDVHECLSRTGTLIAYRPVRG